jgi:hypothetical protein
MFNVNIYISAALQEVLLQNIRAPFRATFTANSRFLDLTVI